MGAEASKVEGQNRSRSYPIVPNPAMTLHRRTCLLGVVRYPIHCKGDGVWVLHLSSFAEHLNGDVQVCRILHIVPKTFIFRNDRAACLCIVNYFMLRLLYNEWQSEFLDCRSNIPYFLTKKQCVSCFRG